VPVCDSTSQDVLEGFFNILLVDLADKRWQTRHGASLAIAKVISVFGFERFVSNSSKAPANY